MLDLSGPASFHIDPPHTRRGRKNQERTRGRLDRSHNDPWTPSWWNWRTCQQHTEWRQASRAGTAQASTQQTVVSLQVALELDKPFEVCARTAWPAGHGPSLMVNGPQKLPAGLRREQREACVRYWRGLGNLSSGSNEPAKGDTTHHEPAQPGPDCSSGDTPPTTPALQLKGKSKSWGPAPAVNVFPWRTLSHRPGGAGRVYCSIAPAETYTDAPFPVGAAFPSNSVQLNSRTRPLST